MSLVEVRAAMRTAGHWAQADLIRDRLHELGVSVEDGREGTTWQRLG
jgi:cysteinyl-tRNA synthetase